MDTDMVYLICKDCKVGLQIGLEDNFSNGKNERRDTFLSDHVQHGAFDTVTDEYFAQVLLAQGFKDVENVRMQPVPIIRNIETPTDFNEAPFGFPKRGESPFKDVSIDATGDYATEKRRLLVEKGIRPSWDEYFLRIANVVKERGTCSRLQVGAVLVKIASKKIIATGYNGAPAGLPHCDHTNDGDMLDGHCAIAEHAERNALLACETDKSYSALYVTATPCTNCMRNAITAGVKRVVYRSEYRVDPAVHRMCEQAGIALEAKGAT